MKTEIGKYVAKSEEYKDMMLFLNQKAEDTLIDLTGLTVGEVGVANVQAEISFKAGYERGKADTIAESLS